MEFFKRCALSTSQRPVYQEGEIGLQIQVGVTIYQGERQTRHAGGVAYLSNFNVYWVGDDMGKSVGQEGARSAIVLSHAHVKEITAQSKFRGSPKISVSLHSSSKELRIGFKAGGRDTFFSKWKAALRDAAWTEMEADAGPKGLTRRSKEFTTKGAGISGIIRGVDRKKRETDASLSEAFSDLDALMSKAKDMVALSKRLNAAQASLSDKDASKFNQYMLNMGIASPVTRESAGSLYHSELARQLADFLMVPVKDHGGMLALTDVYCLFNRARGAELISPDDLFRACNLFEDLKLPLRLRSFESGVIVVQQASHSDEETAKRIAQMVTLKGPQTCAQISRSTRVALALAQEQLETAERFGFVCRDDSFEGLVFYSNFFLHPPPGYKLEGLYPTPGGK